MLKAKKGFSKKELKEDKFFTVTFQIKEWIEKNAQKLILGVVLLIAAIMLINFYNTSKQESSVKAESLLGQAQREQTSGQKESAITLYQEIISSHGGTSAAGRATYLLGKLYLDDNNAAEAKTYLEKYVNDYASDNFLSQAAYAGYATCLDQEKNYAQAGRYYEKAAGADPDFPPAASYLYSAAAAYYQAGDYGKAKSLCMRIKDEVSNNSNNKYNNKADLLLAKIGRE